METNNTKTTEPNLVNKIADGFLLAMRTLSNGSSVNDQLVNQHMANGGKVGDESDPLMDTLTANNENLRTLNETNQRLVDMFLQYTENLTTKYITGGQSSLASSVEQQSSTIEAPQSKEPGVSSAGSLFSAYSGMGNSVSMSSTPIPVDNSSLFQSVMGVIGDNNRNTVENDQKLLAAEEDRQYKGTTTSILKKLENFLDNYSNDGIRIDASSNGGNGDQSSTSFGSILGYIFAGIAGVASGYLMKIGEWWSSIGKSFKNVFKGAYEGAKSWFGKLKTKFLKETAIGQQIEKWSNSFKNLFKSVNTRIADLKTSFLKTLEGWKNSFKESKFGKWLSGAKASVAEKVGKVKNVVSNFKNAANEKGLVKAVTETAKKIPTKIPIVGDAIKSAKKIFPYAQKVGKGLAYADAAGGYLDTGFNVKAVYDKGGSISDVMRTGLAGTIDALANVLLIPNIMNGIEAQVDSYQETFRKIRAGEVKGSTWDYMMEHHGLKEGFKTFFGDKGFMRDTSDEVTVGNGLAASIMNIFGNETESSKAISDAYWNNRKISDPNSGLVKVNGDAAGFGHAALMAPGSVKNSTPPNATVSDKVPKPMVTEADRLDAITGAVEKGVKNATLSPEVREANAQNAKATGDAINGQLFGS